jgi:hypothetical protein
MSAIARKTRIFFRRSIWERLTSIPGTPATGYIVAYWKNVDGKPYFKTSDGVEHGLGGATVTTTMVALAPGVSGNFTIAHGAAAAPTYVVIEMTSGGQIWFQSARYDATNLYLVASNHIVTGKAQVVVVS